MFSPWDPVTRRVARSSPDNERLLLGVGGGGELVVVTLEMNL